MALIKSSSAKSKPRFQYQERTAEDMQNRQRSFSGRDSYFSNKAKFFVSKGGPNKIRIMPPTWDEARHYGFDIYVHYGIGPDNVGYLCLDRMNGEKCPLCEARAEADKDGEEDLAKALRATRRVAVYVIDRNAEGEGPKVWPMPQTVDKEICAQAWDKESGEVFALDNPDEGYDVSFEVEGQGPTKKYVGVRLARRASPLSDEDKAAEGWLQHIIDNPISELMVVHDYDTMKEAFEGKAHKKEDADSERHSAKGKVAAKGAEGDSEGSARPKIGARRPVSTTTSKLPTWQEVHEMDVDEVTKLAAENDVDFGKQEFETLKDCQNWLCKKLKIAEEEEREAETSSERPQVRKTGGTSLKERLQNMSRNK